MYLAQALPEGAVAKDEATCREVAFFLSWPSFHCKYSDQQLVPVAVWFQDILVPFSQCQWPFLLDTKWENWGSGICDLELVSLASPHWLCMLVWCLRCFISFWPRASLPDSFLKQDQGFYQTIVWQKALDSLSCWRGSQQQVHVTWPAVGRRRGGCSCLELPSDAFFDFVSFWLWPHGACKWKCTELIWVELLRELQQVSF